jgi:hypothetical protein
MAGSQPSMAIIIKANTEALKKALAEGSTAIQTTTAAMSKLAASLDGSKLEQRAHNITAAIDSIGGATKLTDAEAKRLLGTLDAWIDKAGRVGKEIPPDLLKTRDALVRVEEPVGHLRATFVELGDQVKATALGMVGAQAIISGAQTAYRTLSEFVSSSVKAYAEAEAAQKKLTAALTSQGRATPDVIKQYNDLATQFQRTTVFGDDLVNEMEALLVEVGQVMPSQMHGALQAATDLSAGLGIDLKNATMLVAKAFSGGGDELGKLKAILGDAYVAGQGMDGILSAIEEKFGGQAQAEIETYSGKIRQLENDWNNFQEAVGKSIVEDPIINALLNDLRDSVAGVGDAAAESKPSFLEWWAILANAESSKYVIRLAEDLTDLYAVMAKAPKAPDLTKGGGALQFGQNLPDTNKLLDEWDAAFKKADASARKFADAQREIKSSLATLTPATIAQIAAMLEEGKAEGDIATFLDVTHTQVRLVQAAEKERADLAKVKLDEMAADHKHYLDEYKKGEEETLKALADLDKEHLADWAFDQEKAAELIRKHNADQTAGEKATLDAVDALHKKHVEAQKKALSDLSNALSQLAEVAGGSFGAVAQGFATIVSSANAARAGVDAFKTGMAAMNAGEALSGLAGMATGIGGIVSAAIAAAQAIKAIWSAFDRNKGRDVVVDFADSFGGFDAMHAKLLELGDAGEALWIKLTQGVGRNNPAQAQAVIDEVTAALAKQKAAQDKTTTATEEQAVATIETASQAQAALEQLGIRLVMNAGEWETWGASVRGVIDTVAGAVRALPLPTSNGADAPAGASRSNVMVFPGGGASSLGGGPGRASLAPAAASSGSDTPVVLTLDGEVVARQMVRLQKRMGGR